MSYEADFFTHYNQYIAAPTPMHPTVAFTFWWADGKTDEYFDVLIMPTRPASLRETRREMYNAGDHFVLRLTIQNEENVPVYFNANYIRIPNH